MLNEDFDALCRFLELKTPEVEGRAGIDVSDEVRKKLAKFASGETTAEERKEMIELLLKQPQLIPFLVAEIEVSRK